MTSHPAPFPPDFYGMLKQAMKKNANQVILAILQCPLFAQAVINLCNTAKVFPGTPADHAQFLGMTSWCFVNQANFLILADQKGLFNTLSAILPLLNHQANVDSGDVKAFFAFANAIIQLKTDCQEAQCQWDLQEGNLQELWVNYTTGRGKSEVILGMIINDTIITNHLAEVNQKRTSLRILATQHSAPVGSKGMRMTVQVTGANIHLE
ncbi:hypothetical protein C0993_009443 [Termitomyces sp. T159_Od127]|nr:hypothetical protein C0993_009443 [Termitomyces sp. T159_Od127]